MKNTIRWTIGAAVILVLATIGVTREGFLQSHLWGQTQESISMPVTTAEILIKDWPAASQYIARVMIEKYGQPGDFNDHALVWRNNGPWKRTIVYRTAPKSASDGMQDSVLEQTVHYRVPLSKFEELSRFDSRVVANRSRNELASISDSEKMNFLALNLADEIVIGWRNAAEARFLHDQVSKLAQSGKSSPYLEGLQFRPDKESGEENE
ncbi:MAG TPA: hypothetical protein DEB40_02505 [Elusimicrobia bacterium]|nr:hypothetical protein [Elusimicrobiota bacterium]HBT60602.1 hypothetical protein [Elusimicrobiota bacterium]